MRIRAFLSFGTAALLALTTVFMAALYISYTDLRQAQALNRLQNEVVRAVFELNAVARDYLVQDSTRPREQWEARYNSLLALLEAAPDQSARRDEHLQVLARRIERLGTVSELLFDHVDTMRRGDELQAQDIQWRDRLVADFRRFSQSAVEAASMAARSALATERSSQTRAVVLLGIFVAGTLGLVIAMWTVIRRRVLHPLSLLQTGILAIEAGNLNHRIGLARKDEIGEVAESFDSMAAELERSHKELEQFAYVASHDLQEPLRMVASYTELLAKRYQGQLDERADKYIHYAVDGAKRMRALINDLLAFSRIGTRGRPLEPTDCTEVVDEAVGNLEQAIADSGAEVIRHSLPTVPADRVQLVQVFQNLISNAIRYRQNAPPRIEIDAHRTGALWTFSVRDNGIGIDPEYAQRIFVIFQRLHPRAETDGNGIGLAIVKKVVERHGGRIWVTSEPGHGSTFRFTIGTSLHGSQAA